MRNSYPDFRNASSKRAIVPVICGRAPLRAIVEVVDDELRIYPVGNSDEECEEILSRLLLDERGRK